GISLNHANSSIPLGARSPIDQPPIYVFFNGPSLRASLLPHLPRRIGAISARSAKMLEGSSSPCDPVSAVLKTCPNAAESDKMNVPDPSSERESELDMLVGFFLMNGFCVVFFLLFGMCVIFSCMRKRPRFLGADRKKKAAETLFPPEDLAPPPPPAQKPLFKTLVKKALRSKELQNLKKAPVVQCDSDGEPTICKKTHRIRNGDGVIFENRIQMSILRSPSTGRSSVRRERVITEEVPTPEASSSLIRQNLLGPLTFDDLYYT
ncbi:hypothetical protein PMAYCL1PPCAC_27237, partial [Pristionchus mayeri]